MSTDQVARFPIIYQEGKGYSAGKTGLMFIPLAIGVIMSAMCAPFVNKDYMRRVKKAQAAGERIRPEARMVPMMFSCWFITIGMFIFAWSSYPELSWAGPAMGGWCVGFGFIFLYNSANNYLGKLTRFRFITKCRRGRKADCFSKSRFVPASCSFSAGSKDVHPILLGSGRCALYGANGTFLHFSLLSVDGYLTKCSQYARLGYQWAGTLMAFIALGCCFIPFIFYFFGERIRRNSKYAYSGDEENEAGKEEKEYGH